MRSSRVFSGNFHIPTPKTSFFRPFYGIFPCVLVFPWLYSLRPEYFVGKLRGSNSEPASIRIGARPGHIAEKVGTPKKTAAIFFDELFKLAVREAKGAAGKFVIPGLGRLVKAHRKARIGRNPQTGEQIKIKAKTVVRLRPSKALKDAVLK